MMARERGGVALSGIRSVPIASAEPGKELTREEKKGTT
jgi:hypothetical protein